MDHRLPLVDVGEDDTLVLVLGQTGSGRSTFINRAVGSTVATVRHGRTCETISISHFTVSHPKDPDRRFILVDTPGFRGVAKWPLRRITSWLKDNVSLKAKVVVIYLIEIDQFRWPEGTEMDPPRLKEINNHLVIVTTKWNNLNPMNANIGTRREDELCRFYACEVHRFHDTQDSAWSIIDRANAPIANVSDLGDKLSALLPKLMSQHSSSRQFFPSPFESYTNQILRELDTPDTAESF